MGSRGRDTVDAVVVGAGINGLVAAAELGKAGWSVALVEAGERLGGFVDSGQRTLPGYVHDTYSSWHPLFVSGPAYGTLGDDLHRHGLRYRNTEGVLTASVARGGRTVLAHRDPEATTEGFEYPADRARYLRMLADVDPSVLAVVLSGEPRGTSALTGMASLALRGRLPGIRSLTRDVVTSGRGYVRREFDGWEVDQLWTPWLLHAGLAPDQATGGFLLPVLAATLHGAGLPVVEGGARRFVAAFESLLATLPVEVRLGSAVEKVVVEDGKAAGVVAGGTTVRARRAVLASVAPDVLYEELLGGARKPYPRFRQGRAAMQIHVALAAPPNWRDPRLAGVPLIHLSDGAGSTGIACAEAEAGLLPRDPTVVVGQQHVLDPARVPDGAASLWIQLQEVPFAPKGDAARELDTSGGWAGSLGRAFTNRVLARITEQAPGLSALVRHVDVLTPADLASANPNAVAGDPYGGSAELDQSLWWRPPHRTPVPKLWHIGASTHPGAGLGGGSGHLVATALTRRR
ncbi:dehydrogenase [Prauserella marina]|uniref:Phytoene dehydrogenase-related protein n=1 Tax=Prauserella marina TaxID=530584 RepID=A0A222VM22_9PSEU|nr:NAD(P)/FAD-dependent oxidoreductase [Prauserella marina]ASR34980.1 dehydrogenase [Prauserella marina]PWV85296.1 phytoene dehydrogenase-like protein [Prauserella marina]SDC00318.1 Phytoene dehydrogenase-related protein [Prauserella marina]